ncbi:MAG: hypothetical protein ACK2US_04315 [Anaerolineae bacterium]
MSRERRRESETTREHGKGRIVSRIKVMVAALGILLVTLSCLPTPTPIDIPTVTSVLVDSATSTPTLASVATEAPAPTGTILPTLIPTNIPTGVPTDVPTDTPIPTIPPLPTDTPVPTTRTALGVFTWAVIVDLDSEPVTYEQAQELVNQAGAILMELTSFSYAMVDFVESTSPGNVSDLAVTYIQDHAGSLPNGIIIFSYGDGDQARTYGGYAFSLAGPPGFRNTFNSPVVGDNRVYISVQHWSHRYAGCGYGSSLAEVPVQDTSFGGECRNRDGITCVERFGYSMCSDAVDDLYASSRTYFGSSVIIHETMHSFGYEGNFDHYGTEQCNTRMAGGASGRPYNPDTWDLAEFQYYNGMCPDVYDNFVNSYQP